MRGAGLGLEAAHLDELGRTSHIDLHFDGACGVVRDLALNIGLQFEFERRRDLPRERERAAQRHRRQTGVEHMRLHSCQLRLRAEGACVPLAAALNAARIAALRGEHGTQVGQLEAPARAGLRTQIKSDAAHR